MITFVLLALNLVLSASSLADDQALDMKIRELEMNQRVDDDLSILLDYYNHALAIHLNAADDVRAILRGMDRVNSSTGKD